MLGFVGLYSLFFKDCIGYNQYNEGFRTGTKIGSNHANLLHLVVPLVGMHLIAYKANWSYYDIEK